MIRIATFCATCLFATAAQAQFLSLDDGSSGGGGGFGFGGSGFGVSTPGVIQSGLLTVVVPESKDAVLALGTEGWVKQKLDKQDGLDIVPVLTANAVAVRYGDKIYAFSSTSKEWDSIDLTPDSEAVPVVSAYAISARDGDLYHAFALSAGRWSTVNLKTGEVQ